MVQGGMINFEGEKAAWRSNLPKLIIGSNLIMVFGIGEAPEPCALMAVRLGADLEVAGGAAEGDGGDEGSVGAVEHFGGGEGAGLELVGDPEGGELAL